MSDSRNTHQRPTEPKMDDFRKGQIDDAQLKLLRSGENSDLKIRCRDRMWGVHKVILAQRCPFFRAALRPGFQEESSGIIVMDEDEPQAINELLTYLYTLSDQINLPSGRDRKIGFIDVYDEVYSDSLIPELNDRPQQLIQSLTNNVKYLSDVLVTADKYQVSDLATLAGQKIAARLVVLQCWAGAWKDGWKEKDGWKDLDKRLTSAFSEALYLEHEMPPLQRYQNTFFQTVISKFDIDTIFSDVEFIQAHPRLTREVLLDRNKALKSMVEDVPKSKRKKYTMQH
ncbi:hypothetical protein GJ744_011628 [Endocarpon pusillum]|uniref:BTB domain-containing protein n=1 Tax=Endocarpon pusillum TaxID=364733 RepID=A0A8H7E4Q1_9EURO|nr:hypothetical protein GJ744_011628 [Endocarpon pusillum]